MELASEGEHGLDALNFAECLDPCSFAWIPWIKGAISVRTANAMTRRLYRVGTNRFADHFGPRMAGREPGSSRPHERGARDSPGVPGCGSDEGSDAVFPNSAAEWEAHWRREGQYQHEEDFEHLREGLAKSRSWTFDSGSMALAPGGPAHHDRIIWV